MESTYLSELNNHKCERSMVGDYIKFATFNEMMKLFNGKVNCKVVAVVVPPALHIKITKKTD